MSVHDVGFMLCAVMVMPTYLTTEANYKDIMVNGARSFDFTFQPYSGMY